jgi:hypothetical protein
MKSAIRNRALFLVGGTAVLVCGWLCSRVWHQPESITFKGKSLDEWLAQGEKDFEIKATPRVGPAGEAVINIGTNAIPSLLQLITYQDRLQLEFAAQKVAGGRAHPSDSPEARAYLRGVYGFALLGPVARPAMPALVRLLVDKRPVVRKNAAFALGYLQGEARGALPALLRVLQDENLEVQSAATWALGNLRLRPELVVPVFTQIISQKYPPPEPFEALESFGAEAKDAVPTLVRLAQGHDPGTRFMALQTLEKVAPLAAAEIRTNMVQRSQP